LQAVHKYLGARPRLTLVLLAALLVILPFVVGAGLGNSWVRVLDFVLLYVLLALGLNIVVGYAGLLDLGYIAFYALGAYLYAWLASPHFGLHLPFWAVLPLGAALAGMFGVLLGAPTLRLRGDYLAIVTLGFGEIIRIFMNNLNAPFNLTNGPQGMNLIDPVSIGGVSLGRSLASVRLYPALHLPVLLPVPGRDPAGHRHRHAPAGFPHRPGLGGPARG
jgi:branched-chain amino acid transport system permease protein